MEPIINPWLIYFADKCELLGQSFITFAMFYLAAYLTFKFIMFLECGEWKIKKQILIIPIIILFVGMLIPNQKTIFAMMAAKQLTPNNIQLVGDSIETTVDYIVDKIEEVIDEED